MIFCLNASFGLSAYQDPLEHPLLLGMRSGSGAFDKAGEEQACWNAGDHAVARMIPITLLYS